MAEAKIDSRNEKTEVSGPEYFTFDKIGLESGIEFGPVRVCYEAFGKLNEAKSNAILILHALSGDAHAAGIGSARPGWWDAMIGPGKAFNTDKYFIVCSNVLGGCSGTTGPSSRNPETGKPYALDFPVITVGDMVAVQQKLLEFLGIKKLLSVAGGSMGGIQALSWLVKYPQNISSVIPIAAAISHSPQQIAFNEVGRQAIMSDPLWNGGDYYGREAPSGGLAVARMVGHITYMSDISMKHKFGRQRKNGSHPFKFRPDFEVEGYLRYRGDSFVKRFDANSYLYLTKAMDNFDIGERNFSRVILNPDDLKALVIGFKSDWLYPPYQSREIGKIFKRSGIQTSYCEIGSSYGHDAFLLEVEEQSRLISHFLNKVFCGYEVADEYEI